MADQEQTPEENGKVVETTKSELDEYIDQRFQENYQEMADEGEGTPSQIGETDLKAFADSMAKAMDHAIQKRVMPAVDKADFNARNGKTEDRLKQAKAYRGAGGVTKYDHPVKSSKAGLNRFRRSPSEEEYPIGSGLVAAKWISYEATQSNKNKGLNNWKAIKEDAKSRGDEQIVKIVEEHQKDLQSGDYGSGGALLPDPVSDDIIAFLHGQTTFRDLDPTIVTLENGSLTFPRIDQAVSVSWRGESTTTNATTPGTGEVKLDERFLQVISIVTEEMRRHASTDVMQILRDHIRKEAGAEEDRALLRGTGANSEPEGLRNLVASGNQDIDREQGGTESTVDEIVGDLMQLQNSVYGSSGEVQMDSPAYVLQARTSFGLQSLTNSNDNLTFLADMLSRGELFGADVGVTTQLPENLDVDSSGSTDHTELYFAEMSEVIIGEGTNMDIAVSPHATVTDGSGSRYDAFANNAQVVRLSHGMDLAIQHDQAAANLKNVDWGADIL